MTNPVVLSGLRPTGRVHLGNYFGAVKNWVDLQDSGRYRAYFFVADLHALTTDYADTRMLASYTRDAVLDWLAVGLDPEKATIFLQSRVPQHAELALYFSMLTPLGWLERVPTYKDQLDALRSRDMATHGFLGYPV
ncbi:MAG: tryptophan--tRNA ligase, partial [Thermoanaerobaculia bacterium]|nr:tryptophan--tRNA ligase [Thermoanaerobaculia bacterium]